MRKHGTKHTGAILPAMAAILLMTAGDAMTQGREMFELPALEVTALQDPLHGAAIDLYESPTRWAEAGALHEQAARELPKNDAAAYFGFQRAAVLYFHADETARARKAMEKAADVAEATGDIVTAAHAWIDAAFLAVAEGYSGKKREYVRAVRELVASELLTNADRERIIARVDGSPVSPEVARVAMGLRFGSPYQLPRAD